MLKTTVNWRSISMLRLIFALAALAMAGCQSTGPEVVDPEPVTAPVGEPHSKLPPRPPPPAVPLAIVVSANVPSYVSVEKALTSQLDAPFKVFNMDEHSQGNILQKMQLNKIESFVAIGDRALDLVSGYSENADIIYSQIFNPIENSYRGVAAIPPMLPQLKYWQSLNPNLQHVGVISSPRFNPTAKKLIDAGKSLGIQIVSREVSSDKAALREFRRLVPVVEGFVILPDASILSPSVVRRMVQHANANSVQLLSYNLAIFSLGAYMHVTSAYEDIAGRIIDLLEDKNLDFQNLNITRIRVRGAQHYININE